jgi:uncharacterized protein DUF4394
MRKIVPAAAFALASLASVIPASTIASAGPADNDSSRGCVSQSRFSNLRFVGLTADGRLICGREDRPSSADNIGRVKGLQGDTSLVGIDFRPATGDLYGLGSAGGVYTIDTSSARATKVAQLDQTLSGTNFGVDFNPTVDRLRIVSDTGQNLAANVDTGVTAVNTNLNTGGTVTTGVSGAAYTNNDASADSATTLFDIDTNLDQVSVQAPPAAGSLNPTGKLGVDAGPTVGFDIFSLVDDDRTLANKALASLVVDGRARLFEIDPLTGLADFDGSFDRDDKVVDIAIPLDD